MKNHYILFAMSAAIFLMVTHWAAYMEGRHDVMKNTVVRGGEPYYRGIFFGECGWTGPALLSQEFCATLNGR